MPDYSRLTDDQKLRFAAEADRNLDLRPFSRQFQLVAVNRALHGEVETKWGDMVRELAAALLGES